MTPQEFLEYQESYQGYCTNCNFWTRECTEPDAEDYDCPECGENTVIGAENALIMGEIEIDE